jgi:hypothetical protein
MHNPEKSENGKTVDFLLPHQAGCRRRGFFRRGFKSQGRLPRAITLDDYQAPHRAAREVLSQHRRRERTRKLYQSFFSSHA